MTNSKKSRKEDMTDLAIGIAIAALGVTLIGIGFYRFGRINGLNDQIQNLYTQWDDKISMVPDTDKVWLDRDLNWIQFTPDPQQIVS